MKKYVGVYLMGLIFITIGGIFIWAGTYLVIDNYHFAQTAIPVQGTVTNVSSYISYENTSTSSSSGTSVRKPVTFYAPTVGFQTTDGQNIEFKPQPSSSYRYIGEKLDILYNPTNPNDAREKITTGGFALLGVFPLIGIVAVLVGLLAIIAPIIKLRQNKWLHQYGTTITVPVLRIEKQTAKNGDVYGYTVVSQWQNPQDQEMYIFKSDVLNYDPTSFVEGKQVSVLIDANNPKRYEIDSSTLPKEA